MATVWVVNFAGHDYTLASRHGEIRPITEGYVSMGSLDRVLGDVASALSESKAEDWLVPSGLIVLNALAAAVWLRKHGSLRLLMWDRKLRDYRQMIIPDSHIDHLLEQFGGPLQPEADTNTE